MSFRCSRLLALVGGYRKESSGTKRELISQDLLAAGPVSRILSAGKLPLAGTTYRRTAIPLGRALLRGSSDLPGGLAHRAGTRPPPPEELRAMSNERWAILFTHNSRLTAHSYFSDGGTSSLFGLAPCGVCHARSITGTAVRSYRTFSPLPGRCRLGGIFSVALSVNRP